jgi:hypothetical protein
MVVQIGTPACPVPGTLWRGLQTGLVRSKSAVAPVAVWRPWTIVLPCLLALVWSALMILADGAMGIMASWDTSVSSAGWVTAGLAGHCVLGSGSAVLLALGLSAPSRRRVAAVVAWLIIPVGFGWLLLTGMLVGSTY